MQPWLCTFRENNESRMHNFNTIICSPGKFVELTQDPPVVSTSESWISSTYNTVLQIWKIFVSWMPTLYNHIPCFYNENFPIYIISHNLSSHHGVSLSWSSLPVCEHTSIVALKCWFYYSGSKIFVYLYYVTLNWAVPQHQRVPLCSVPVLGIRNDHHWYPQTNRNDHTRTLLSHLWSHQLLFHSQS